jgi:hypothetical protein
MRTSASRLVLGRATSISALGLVALLVIAAPASGAKFKDLGKPARHIGPGESCTNCNEMQLETAPSSPSYVVPRGRWTIVSWKAHGNHDDPGKARLRIYRPTAVDGQFKIVVESKITRFPAGQITKHKARTEQGGRIHVRKGDHLGMVGVGLMATLYETGKAGDVAAGTTGGYPPLGSSVGTATTWPLSTSPEHRVNVAVTLKRRG